LGVAEESEELLEVLSDFVEVLSGFWGVLFVDLSLQVEPDPLEDLLL
jgi:hypothetical protein